MAALKKRELDAGWTSEVDMVDELTWCQMLGEFDDANIYQTWPYGAVISGRRNMGHIVLRKDGCAAAIAQIRIAKLPLLNIGIAYVRWGPLWRRKGAEHEVETFRQGIRALRNEYACRRGLVVRLLPVLFEDDPPVFSAILAEEGFSSAGVETRSRTILMDVRPSLQELRDGMRPHWKRELKLAERKALEIVEGVTDDLFERMIDIYREMVSRKQFIEGNDINQFRTMQAQLPEKLKMRIMLCRSEIGVCAGVVWTSIGKTSVYLFGATSNLGMKSNGSYLLHWKLLERLKEDGVTAHDLNGINPLRNPGTHKFKNDFAGKHGKEVTFLGQFESHANSVSHSCVKSAEALRAQYKNYKDAARASQGMKAAAEGSR
jgi:hypothetical protein